jgi:hypothetical protein
MRLLILFCLVLAAHATLSAQSAKVTLRTLAMNATPLPDDLWTLGDSDAVALSFSTVQPSEPFRIKRLSPMPVYQGKRAEKGKPTDADPSLIRLPENASAVLLLGWINSQNTPQFLAIPDPFATAKRDDWMIINASPTEIALKIGANAKPFLIKPSSHQAIRITAPANEGAAVTIATRVGEEWQTFYSTYWPVYEDKRCIILFTPGEDRIQVKQIFEELAKAAAP